MQFYCYRILSILKLLIPSHEFMTWNILGGIYMKKNIIFNIKLSNLRNQLLKIICLDLFFNLTYLVMFFLLNKENLSEMGQAQHYYFFTLRNNNGPFFYIFVFGMTFLVPIICMKDFILDFKVEPFVLSRLDKKQYFNTKIMINFFKGFTVSFLFLLSSYLMCHFILKPNLSFFYNLTPPHSDMEVLEYGANFLFTSSLGNLYHKHPSFYYFIYMIILSITSGIHGIISYLTSLITKKKIIIYLSSFASFYFIFATWTFLMPRQIKQYNILNIITPFTSITNPSIIPFFWLLYILIIFTIIAVFRYIYCEGDLEHE